MPACPKERDRPARCPGVVMPNGSAADSTTKIQAAVGTPVSIGGFDLKIELAKWSIRQGPAWVMLGIVLFVIYSNIQPVVRTITEGYDRIEQRNSDNLQKLTDEVKQTNQLLRDTTTKLESGLKSATESMEDAVDVMRQQADEIHREERKRLNLAPKQPDPEKPVVVK